MTTRSPLDLLDNWPALDDPRHPAWMREVQRSLLTRPEDWKTAAAAQGDDGLTTERAWVLLDWVEHSASRLLIEPRSDIVAAAALAMSLLEASPLDRREVMVVAALLRRASQLQGLDFTGPARAGCDAAGGDLGERCWEWLEGVSASLPSSHREISDGPTLRFERIPSSIDVERLQRWATGDDDEVASGRRSAVSPGDADHRTREQLAAIEETRRKAAVQAQAAETDTQPGGRVLPMPALIAVYLVMAALGITGIVVLYDRGIIPLAGPFVAVLLAVGVIAFVRPWWARRQVGHAAAALPDLKEQLAAELATDRGARPSGADDQSLTTASELAEDALKNLAWGLEHVAIHRIATLAALTRDQAWAPRAPVTTQVARVETFARRLRRVLPRP